MNLILRPRKFYNHVSQDVVEEFESSILAAEHGFSTIRNNSYILSNLAKQLFLKTSFNLHKICPKIEGEVFAVHMGPDYAKSLPFFSRYTSSYGYFFDAWPSTYSVLERFLEQNKLKKAFFSSSQTTQYLQQKGFDNVHWIPEGVDPSSYRFLPNKKKDIDVLELGRRYPVLHNQLKPLLASKKRSHLYESTPGEIIFPTRDDFINGLARTNISICLSRQITHPMSAEGIDTMTNRYLQSMASKCIILGQAPQEMMSVFGYNPVVELDKSDPETQVMAILENLEIYYPLVEKNYFNVVNHHSWANRWLAIKSIIES